MPIHNGWLPREGLYVDPVFKAIGKTALNPFFVLPLVLAGSFTKKGGNIRDNHPVAFARIKILLYLGVARYINGVLSRRALNNGVNDNYVWSKEIVVVTGGSGGIGSNIVRLLSERGIKVVVLDIQPLSFKAASTVHYFQCDITSPAKLAAVADEIRARVGHPTVLINNAGVARGRTILDSTERDIRFTFDVNALAHYWTVKEFLPEMVRRNHGMVVTVASYASWLTAPDMVDYAASKAAAQAFHEGLTVELNTRYGAPRVRTVLVNQGYTKTPLFSGYNSRRSFLIPALEPETVADAVVRQVLSGSSGQIIKPGFGNLLAGLGAMPHWYQLNLREATKTLMTNFHGRQVVQDLDKFYAEKAKGSTAAVSTDAEGSTILVSGPN